MKILLLAVALVASLGCISASDVCDRMGVSYCSSCWDPPMLCYDCSYGRVLEADKSGCRSCDDPIGCKECHIDGDTAPCDECYSHYVMMADTTCEACGDLCAECSLLEDNSKTCDTCYDRTQHSQANVANCVSCGSNCASCTVLDITDSVRCDVCDDGYMVDSTSGKCVSCPTKCKQCFLDSDGKTKLCSSCMDNYNLNNLVTKCIACQSSCTSCADAESTSSASIAECAACATGYYLNTDEFPICMSCDTNCAACSEAGVCDECDTGYYNDASFQCQGCPWMCMSCGVDDAGDVICDTCYDRYALKSATLKSCDTCPANCDVCTPELAAGGQCTTCSSEYYRDTNKKCQSCPSNCYACSTASGAKCDSGQCFTNYVRDADGLCQKCADNCVFSACAYNTTTNEASCTSCDPYYAVKDDFECVQCTGCADCTYSASAADVKCRCSNSDQGLIESSTNLYNYRGGCDNVGSTSYVCDEYFYYDLTANSGTWGCVDCGKTGCVHCNSTDNNFCLDCDSNAGYAVTPMDDGTCYACSGMSNCDSCTYDSTNVSPVNAEQCSTCASGYDVYTDADNNDMCRSCGSLCATCSFSTSGTTITSTCTSCKSNAVDDPDNSANCKACVSPCTDCTVNSDGDTECKSTGCPVGYAHNSDTFACDPCGDFCGDCEYVSGDIPCFSTSCDTYYGRLSDGSCSECPYDCNTCSITFNTDGSTDDILFCDLCDTTFTKNELQCTPCPSKCDTCEVDGAGSVLGRSSDVYYRVDTDTDTCTKCVTSCQTCNANTCSVCDDGTGLSTDRTSCVGCAALTKIDNCGLCEGARADGNATCLMCNAGYLLSDNSTYCNMTSLLFQCSGVEDHSPECITCEDENSRYLDDDLQLCVIECYTCGSLDYEGKIVTGDAAVCNPAGGNFSGFETETCLYGHCGALLTRDASGVVLNAMRGCDPISYLNTTCEAASASSEEVDEDLPNDNGPSMCQEGADTVETCADCCYGDECNDYEYNSASLVYVSLTLMALVLSLPYF